MPSKLNQRRYSEVVRLLKDVVKNDKQPIDRRMRAAVQLEAIYARADARADKLRDREYRRELRGSSAATVDDRGTIDRDDETDGDNGAPATGDDAKVAAQRFLDSLTGEPNDE